MHRSENSKTNVMVPITCMSLLLNLCFDFLDCFMVYCYVYFSYKQHFSKEYSEVCFPKMSVFNIFQTSWESIQSFTAAAAKSLQSCLTLCDPIDVSPQVETLALYSLVAEDFIIDRY